MHDINDDLIVDNYLEAYFEYINQYPVLSKEEIIELFKKADYETIFNHNLRLVPFIAKRFIKNRGTFSFMDLIQEGNMGLMEAIQKYDYTLNKAFSTYAAFWIKQKISLAIARNSRTINVSYEMHFEQLKYKKALNKLTIALGRTPTNEELSKELNISLDKIDTIINSEKLVCSLDTPIETFANAQENNLINEDKILDTLVLKDIIKYAKLTKKDFEILQDYYYYELPVKTICAKNRCTRQNVEANIKNSLKKIQIAKEEFNKPKITKLTEIPINELYYYFKNFSDRLIKELFTYANLTSEEINVLDKLLGINSLVIYTIEDISEYFSYDKDYLYMLIKTSFQKLASLIKLLYPTQTKIRKRKVTFG